MVTTPARGQSRDSSPLGTAAEMQFRARGFGFCFFKDFIDLFEKEGDKAGAGGGAGGEGEAGFLQGREPRVGLDPGALGS